MVGLIYYLEGHYDLTDSFRNCYMSGCGSNTMGDFCTKP